MEAAKLVYVEQYRAWCVHQRVDLGLLSGYFRYPDLSDYLVVCNVFCGTKLIVSFNSTTDVSLAFKGS